ncbi:MAG: alpha/beta hydrolase [Eubacteriales bacterium]|nr:alpha/beta hydrolase [Eubacteriales bacterium]
MTSLKYRMYESTIKMAGLRSMLTLTGKDLDGAIRRMRSGALKLPEGRSKGMDHRIEQIGNVRTGVIRKQGTEQKKAVLYLYGGEFLKSADEGDLEFAREFASETDAEVWLPLYPTCSEAYFDEIVSSVCLVYEKMLESFSPDKIFVFGQNAGASLGIYMLGLFRKLELSVDFPKGMILSSPLLRYPLSPDENEMLEELDMKDIMTPASYLRGGEPDRLIFGEDSKYKCLANIPASDLTGYPETWIFMGTEELNYATLNAGVKAFERDGVSVHTEIGEGMMHCWGSWPKTPEAKAMRSKCFAIVNEG